MAENDGLNLPLAKTCSMYYEYNAAQFTCVASFLVSALSAAFYHKMSSYTIQIASRLKPSCHFARVAYTVKRTRYENRKDSDYNNERKINALGNMAAMFLGFLFLGDIFELWNFKPFERWWLVFLYISVICGLLTNGVTRGGVMLGRTAVVLTIGMFADVDGRVWGAAVIVYLAYIGWCAVKKGLHSAAESEKAQKEME